MEKINDTEMKAIDEIIKETSMEYTGTAYPKNTVIERAMKLAQIEALKEVAKRWHTNKLQRGFGIFKTLDEIILELIKEVAP